MAEIVLNSDMLEMLGGQKIQAGDNASYELCKALWEYHPLGGKLVEKPVNLALFKRRQCVLEDDPGNRIITHFEDAWTRLEITQKIKNLHYTVRCYGAEAIGIGDLKSKTDQPLDLWKLQESDLYINVFDPLNTAGSMIANQDPNSPEFQAPKKVTTIQGVAWDPSRTLRLFNGSPIYLSFQNSTFGYTGRSVFQRVLYPMQSYLKTMPVNDMVAEKAGLLIIKQVQNSSTVSGLMGFASRRKREMTKSAITGNVMTIGQQDAVESLNLQNVDDALKGARENIIADIAAGSDIPANLIKDEAFALGFSDGTEDAKSVAQYIDGVRQTIDSTIEFFENIVQHVAWDESFYEVMAAEYPEYIAGRSYKEMFYVWQRDFVSTWPPLLEEPKKDKQEGEAKVIDQVTKLFTAITARIDPENYAIAVQWMADIANSLESIKNTPLLIDFDALAAYEPPAEPQGMPEADSGE